MAGFTFPIVLPLTWEAPRASQFWAGQGRDIKAKVSISRPDARTWTDITSYVTYINRKRGDVSSVGTGQTGADVMSQSCTVRIANARRPDGLGGLTGDSFHPLDRVSPWNQFDVNGDGSLEYAPLLFPRREIVIDVATVPVNTTPGPVDWIRIFHGYLGDGIDADAKSSEIVVECRDVMKLLMDTFIEVKRTYGSEAGTPAEIVMQQIIDDNMTNGPRIYCPISPGLMIKPYELGYKSVADALVEIANQCGWWIGSRWIPDYNDFRLTFMAPPRTKDASCADWSFDWTRDILMQTLKISDREIRNVVCLTYRNEATGMRETITVWDQPSIDAFDRRAMGIEEADTSLIDTPEEANAMAMAALHDQKDLPATTEIELPFLPTLDIFDGILINNPLLSSTRDFYAVNTAEDVLEVRGDKLTARTRVVAAGRVMGGLWKWRRMETRPGSPAHWRTEIIEKYTWQDHFIKYPYEPSLWEQKLTGSGTITEETTELHAARLYAPASGDEASLKGLICASRDMGITTHTLTARVYIASRAAANVWWQLFLGERTFARTKYSATFQGDTSDATKMACLSGVFPYEQTTGLSLTYDAWHVFKIVVTATSVKYYVDDVLVATHTSNLPVNSSRLGAVLYVGGSASGAAEMRVDYVTYAVS